MSEPHTDLSYSFGRGTGGFITVLRIIIHFTLTTASLNRISVEYFSFIIVTTLQSWTPDSLIHRDQLLYVGCIEHSLIK